MADPFSRARAWLDKQPAAISGAGGHDATYHVACVLHRGFGLSDSDTLALLSEYNHRCDPPWKDSELHHKLDAATKASHDRPSGYMLNGSSQSPRHAPQSHRKASDTPKRFKAPVTASGASELPKPMADGTRELIRACFREGEGIRVALAELNDEGKEIPSGSGSVLSREEWLRKLDKAGGDPNKILSSTERTGIYVTINPMRLGGSADADVSAFRHALIEFDNISPAEQFALYTSSRLPCAAIISSGGKSVHAWVKLDAVDRAEYDTRRALLYDYFSATGLQIDGKNKNPSRFSRLPNCVRGNARQELLALNTGAESFTEWLKLVAEDELGPCETFASLMGLDTANDPNCVIGFRDGKTLRYLCRGKSAWVIGPCIHGETMIYDPIDGTNISVRDRHRAGVPFVVRSMNSAGQVVNAHAMPPIRFRENPMLRFDFSSGESITVTPKHRFWDGSKYREASDLAFDFYECGQVRLPSTSGISPQEFPQGVPRLTKTILDYQDDYRTHPRFCDAQLHLPTEDGQALPPSPADAREHIRCCLPKDGLDGESEYSRQRQPSSRHSMPGLIPHAQMTLLRALEHSVFEALRELDCGSSSFSPQLPPQTVRSDKAPRTTHDVPASSVAPRDSRKAFPLRKASAKQSTDQRQATRQFFAEKARTQEAERPFAIDLDYDSYAPTIRQTVEIVNVSEVEPDFYFDFEVPIYRNYIAAGVVNHNSGIGKSSLNTEFAIAWALGKPAFGITPARPLKSLIIQGENDAYDLAEMVQGIADSHGFALDDATLASVNERVLFKTETTSTGLEFISRLHRLIDRERPDIVWCDPLLSFAGVDVTKADQCTMFLRSWLQPVLEATGAVLIGIHHTGKPKSARETQNWSVLDFAYSGLGSSELVNWARAVMVLHPHGECYELKLAKRGPRAGATHPDGSWAFQSVWIKHAVGKIRWEQIEPPAENEKPQTERKEKKPATEFTVAGMNLASFLAGCKPEGESLRHIRDRLQDWLASDESPDRMSVSEGTATKCIRRLSASGVEKISFKSKLYFKGKKA